MFAQQTHTLMFSAANWNVFMTMMYITLSITGFKDLVKSSGIL
jgi:hypothetical protein